MGLKNGVRTPYIYTHDILHSFYDKKKGVRVTAIAKYLALMLGVAIGAHAQWSYDPKVNTPICTAANYQDNPRITSDGAGGAIITWMDLRNGSYDIYVQRVNASGIALWAPDGIPICTAPQNQFSPGIATDGAGGAIITWQDYRGGATSDIYAQRVSSSGAVEWALDGVAICAATGSQFNPVILDDGSGGAIITWYDYRGGVTSDIYAQRVNASGVVQWDSNGVAICTAADNQFYPAVTGDGAGGAIIAWEDYRAGFSDIYAQRIDTAGAVQWTTDGVAICTAAKAQTYPTIVGDGAGGAIITWMDWRVGTASDNYAQRVNASGVVQWTANGVAICTADNIQGAGAIVSDGSGGAIIAWEDLRNGTTLDIYAQRVDASGNVQWISNGVAICSAANDQDNPAVIGDGSGGAIITWRDYRNGTYSDIYAQHIDASGMAQSGSNGVPISTAAINQDSPVIISDGSGGAIITWDDGRNGDLDIYAQRIDRTGYIAIAPPSQTTVRDILNDQGGAVEVSWGPSYLDVMPETAITSYTLYRGLKSSMAPAGSIALGPEEYAKQETNNPVSRSNEVPGKKIFLKLPFSPASSDTIFWENIATLNAENLPNYSFRAATVSDSGPQGIPWYYFMVRAKTSNRFVFWDSPIDSGYSVDNLSPSPAQSVVAAAVPGQAIGVRWDKNTVDPDVDHYEVHRSTVSGFTPVAGTKIGQTIDTTLVDRSPVGGVPNYYRVVTVDIHGNPSTPSPQASVIVLGVKGDVSGLPGELALEQNYPNPFNPSTVINYQLPVSSYVRLFVYNVLGEEVGKLVDGMQEAGYKSVEFSAASRLPSGVYLYRIHAGSRTEIKKMLLVR